MLAVYGLAFAGGIASHVAFFHRGEHHMYGARYLLAFVALYASSIFAAVSYGGFMLHMAVVAVSTLAASHLAGLFTSLFLYRAVLSPLCRFPGPFGARFSDFFYSTHLTKLDLFKVVLRHHEQYGDFVRVGSNTLSIRNPQAVEAIHGPKSRCRKAAWYELTRPMVSMHTTRDRGVHDRRRRN